MIIIYLQIIFVNIKIIIIFINFNQIFMMV